uniref:Uncharacterized protein n=1 Tax=viral metagenome TaxID=1070528 RepID=A0A6C0I1K6_9ZZZZ
MGRYTRLADPKILFIKRLLYNNIKKAYFIFLAIQSWYSQIG